MPSGSTRGMEPSVPPFRGSGTGTASRNRWIQHVGGSSHQRGFGRGEDRLPNTSSEDKNGANGNAGSRPKQGRRNREEKETIDALVDDLDADETAPPHQARAAPLRERPNESGDVVGEPNTGSRRWKKKRSERMPALHARGIRSSVGAMKRARALAQRDLGLPSSATGERIATRRLPFRIARARPRRESPLRTTTSAAVPQRLSSRVTRAFPREHPPPRNGPGPACKSGSERLLCVLRMQRSVAA
eukprot:scaffold56_cov390-Pavlova_lutheri.AAC.14